MTTQAFEYLPGKEEPLVDNFQRFENLLYEWREKESDVINSMEAVTGLRFDRMAPTKVYENPQDMARVKMGELRVPAYMGDHIQTFLMPKYRFIGVQIHELFHELYEQNDHLVGAFIGNYAEHNRLHPITGSHIYVHAGLREVAAEVFGGMAKKVVEGQEFWRYVKVDSPVQKFAHHYKDSTGLSRDSKEKMRAMREHVSGSGGA
jgi:hypothetical protein